MYLHINANKQIIQGFKWTPLYKLVSYEKINENRVNNILNYIKTNSIPTVPSILACHRSLTVIEGVNRLEAMRKLNVTHAPTLLLDYNHEDIIINSTYGTKKTDILFAARNNSKLCPTEHFIREKYTYAAFPLSILSLQCPLPLFKKYHD